MKFNGLALLLGIVSLFSPVSSFPINPQTSHELYRDALEAASAGDYQQAIVHLQNVIARDSSLTRAYLTLADVYWYDNSLAEAEAFFKEAHEANPKEPNNAAALARVFWRRNELAAAQQLSETAFKLGSRSRETLEILVESCVALRRTNTLASILRDIRRADEQKALYELGYAMWRLRVRNLKKAESTIHAYLSTDSTDAHGYRVLAEILREQKNLTASNQAYRKALSCVDSFSPGLEVTLLTALAANALTMDRSDSAVVYLRRALDLANTIGAAHQTLDLRLKLCEVYVSRQQLREVVEVAREGLLLAGKLSARQELVQLQLTLARTLTQTNNIEPALEYYRLAAKLAQEDDQLADPAAIYFAMAELLTRLSKLDQAEAYLKQCRKLADRNHDLSYRALFALADLRNSRGETEAAKEAYEAVVRYAQSVQDIHEIERCFLRLAGMYISHQNWENAKYYLSRADALARQTFQLPFAANHRWMQGTIELANADIESAETYFLHAIELGVESGSYLAMLAGQAGLIRTYLQTDFPKMAVASADSALKYLDEYFFLCINDPNYRYFDIKSDLIIPAINAYASVGDLQQIYHVIETYKAVKHFLNTKEARFTTRSALADSVRNRIDRTNSAIRQKWNLLWDTWHGDRRENLEQIAQVKQEINDLLRKEQTFLDTIEESAPEVARLFKPPVQTLARTQALLKELKASLIHYLVGYNATYILVVTPEDLQCIRVKANRSSIETLVREMNPVFRNSDNYDFISSAPATSFRVDQAAHLYKLLMEPVMPLVEKGQLLLFSPDDVLKRAPFEALVTNPGDLLDRSDYKNAKYLVESHPMLYIPFSAFLRTKPSNDQAQGKILLAFAAARPESPGQEESGNGQTNGHTYQTAADVGVELEILTNIFGRRHSETYTGKNATKLKFNSEAPKYELLHLALPAMLNDRAPLYSHISFAPDAAKHLNAYELFNTDLQAELAVLSDCEIKRASYTGGGIGIAGMLHGFIHAGVPSLIASLWLVPVQERSPLFAEFYRNLRLGRNKAEALQAAKLSYLENENRNPYFWSGVVLYGDPAALHFPSDEIRLTVYLAMFGLLALAAVFARQIIKMVR